MGARGRLGLGGGETARGGFFGLRRVPRLLCGILRRIGLVLADGFKYSKHTGVLADFHKGYIKSGRLPAEIGKRISALYDLRHVGDYGGPAHVDRFQAERAVADARDFVSALRELLSSDIPTD